jgi:hypothetical protein
MALKNSGSQYFYGFPRAIGVQFPNPRVDVSDPTIYDVGGTTGQVWINTSTPTVNFCIGNGNGQANWVNVYGGDSVFNSLTVNTSIVAGTTITAGGTITATNGNMIAGNTAASATGPNFELRKSRTGGVITTGDVLGNLIFEGNDGTTNIVGAAIVATSTGTIAANRVASNLTFLTHPDSTSAAATRLTINSAGNLTIASPDSGVALTITAGGQTITAGALTMTNGNIVVSNAGTYLALPGDARLLSGTGAPAGGLANAIGSMYINLTAASAVTRLYIATAVGAWTNVTCAA